MDTTNFNEQRNINTDRFAFSIAGVTKDIVRGGDYTLATAVAAYVLLKARNDESISTESLDSFIKTSKINDRIACFIKETIGNCWSNIIVSGSSFESEVLLAHVLYADTYNFRMEADYTPSGVSKLAARMLDVKPNDTVADYCTGRGGFIRELFETVPNARYFGNEINTTSVCIAMMRADILGGNIEIAQEDMFDVAQRSFDKAFSNYPFGLRTREINFNGKAVQRIIKRYPQLTKSVSSDWIFNAILVESIKEDGKAIGVMSNAGTWNKLDTEMRKAFLENGYIEAVIALPERLYESTAIPTCLIVFSHGNTEVTFVDARSMCEKGRRNNIITDRDVEKILSCVTIETEYSRKITISELANNYYIINPIRYMEAATALEDGVPFDSVIANITRGAQITASQLDDLVSDIPTDVQYLMLGNIQDGTIDTNLPYLKGLDPKLERYCLKNRSLILSKNGYPFKVAIATIPEGKKVLANGNLYVIEIDETKADPYFIKAFLESDKGIAALKSITVGATIPNIGVEQLKKILVPSTPIEKQHEIAQRYLAKLDEIALYRLKIEKATTALRHIIDLSEDV